MYQGLRHTLFMICLFTLATAFVVSPLFAQNIHETEYPALESTFDRNELINTNSYFVDPDRFNMQQSYSMSYMSSSNGESMSSGVYLNHLTFNLSDPLLLFADIGYHTPFHASLNNPQYKDPRLSAYEQGSSMIIPRVGLEYRPSDNLTMALSFIQTEDYYKAGGNFWGNSYYDSPYRRTPFPQRVKN